MKAHLPLACGFLAAMMLSAVAGSAEARKQSTAGMPVEGAVYSGVDKDVHYKEVLEITSVHGSEVLFDVTTEADFAGIGEVCEGEISDAKGHYANDQITFSGEEGCKLTVHFSRQHDSVSITDNNCHYYHGANCDFGGKNLRRVK